MRGLLEKYARFIHLDDTQWALLMANLEAFCTEHRRQSAAETKSRQARQLAAAPETTASPATTPRAGVAPTTGS